MIQKYYITNSEKLLITFSVKMFLQFIIKKHLLNESAWCRFIYILINLTKHPALCDLVTGEQDYIMYLLELNC